MINKTQDEIIKAWKNTSSSDPLVSISCITYNHINYIEQCLDGFLEQETDYPFEILIHDDCSTDGTTEIIQKYSTKYPDIIKPMYETENIVVYFTIKVFYKFRFWPMNWTIYII